MAISARLFKNGAYLQSSTTLFIFFASWGIWWSFFSTWLDKSLGLNGGQIGTIYSVNSLTTIAVLLFYGMAQDRLVLKRHLVILASAVMACLAPFAIFVYEPMLVSNFPLGVLLGAIYLPFGYTAAVGLLEAFSERLSRTYGFAYGQARGWGSLGYAVAALFTGFIFTVNPHINFYLGSLFGVVCLLVQIFWKTDKVPLAPGHSDHPHAPSLREIFSVLKLKHLWIVIGFVIFSWTFYNLYDNQMFPNFYRELFVNEDTGLHTYGILNSGQVFLEGFCMMLVPILMRRVGVRNILMLGVSVMCLRILGSAVFTDPVIVSVIKMFHAIEVPLFVLGIFRYLTLHFPAALSATLYMVGFEISAQLGSALFSTPFGYIRDALGFQPTFLIIAGVVACAGVWAFFALKKDDEDVQGDPFIRASRSGVTGVIKTVQQP
ncbi:oligosaccharide MFS transporter [Leucobacter ruminantium]|uniref:Oligosaccharide MFS transporter n=1 Tax=Leucobacter ruminantium TaxID=1289170 RepID=A0A939RY41_9MICO|nr:oligosaccharide MFS transporter [Leucobacter ruminantium]MBO1804069.1 oligosaccharide MFS transporter [Leucobacter ruminantium]